MVSFNNGQRLLDPELLNLQIFCMSVWCGIRYLGCNIPKSALVIIHC